MASLIDFVHHCTLKSFRLQFIKQCSYNTCWIPSVTTAGAILIILLTFGKPKVQILYFEVNSLKRVLLRNLVKVYIFIKLFFFR